MRSIFFLAQAMVVIALAYWAYNENYATQAALKRVNKLQTEIGLSREHLGVLHAEWAYLNRPARLRDLADLNYDSLRLIPMTSGNFGEVDQVAFPKLNVNDIRGPVDTSAVSGPAKASAGVVKSPEEPE